MQREAEIAHEVAARAIRRLDVLAWVILASAVALATAAGAAVAWLIEPMVGLGFRPTWTVASFLLFVVPGVIALIRMRREEREARAGTRLNEEKDNVRR